MAAKAYKGKTGLQASGIIWNSRTLNKKRLVPESHIASVWSIRECLKNPLLSLLLSVHHEISTIIFTPHLYGDVLTGTLLLTGTKFQKTVLQIPMG